MLSSTICGTVTVDEVAIRLSSSISYHFTQIQRSSCVTASVDRLPISSLLFQLQHPISNSRHLLFYSYYCCIYRSSYDAHSGLKIPIQRLCSPSYCTCNSLSSDIYSVPCGWEGISRIIEKHGKSKTYECWNFNSGNYLFTTHTK